MSRFFRIFFLVAWIFPSLARPDAGVLIPSGVEQPDPQKLSLEEMRVDVRIDGGTARVSIRQIFASHQTGIQEGEWVFALPAEAAVSDFAVWDDVTRIPGVILERRRAEEIYESLKAHAIDPGLLRQGEYGAEEARRGTVFSAKVAPIPGYGFKRVEFEYHERLEAENLRTRFAIPLRPDAYQQQTAKRFSFRLEFESGLPLADFAVASRAYPLVVEREGNRVAATFEGENVAFSEDLAIEYALDPAGAGRLDVLTYRDPNPGRPHVTAKAPPEPETPPGYFLASALIAPPAAAAGEGPPRAVVALFDTSLSMQWEKLDRSFQALEALLLGLRPRDRFNVLTFNAAVTAFEPSLQPADRETVERALGFVRSQRIRGGTNLAAAWRAAAAQFANGDGEAYLVHLTDAGATAEAVRNSRLAGLYAETVGALTQPPRSFIFAVGDDANLPLLRMLAGGDGVLTHVRSTEPIDFKLNAFLGKIGRSAVADLRLETAPGDAFEMVYPTGSGWFAGSVARWVGRYVTPGVEAVMRAVGGDLDAEARLTLPANDQDHPHVAREWARARVDALLAKIERDGEDEATINEIIYWSKKFKFVTPYTSFLAAPRSLLRPRVIRPGDPILRVRTDPAIVSVTALFPFGLVKQLRYLDAEDIWQTRFLAPKDTADGRHTVRLILRDKQGRVFNEEKSFLVASKPPTVRAHLEQRNYRPGEQVELRVSASRSTRTLTARLYGAAPVSLRWNPAVGYNTGSLVIPRDLPAGEYKLRLTAEDFAHNIGVEEVSLAVAP